MKKRVLIGIAGGTASGKTTLAKEIGRRVRGEVVIIEQDAYYKDLSHLPLEERKKVNYDHPSAFDMDLLVTHIRDLLDGKPIRKPVYSFELYTRLPETVLVKPKDVIILEGILIFEDKRLRDISRATELCGAYDRNGRYILRIRNAPWCDGAVFTLNPNPDIPEDDYHTLNKAHLNYTPQMGDRLYSGENGQLDGEYLDSLEGWGGDKNFRREHFKYVSIPLTFDPQSGRPIILQIFSTY